MKKPPDKKQLRTFGLGLAFVLTVFSILNFYKGHTTLPSVLLTLAVISAALALFLQPAIKPVYIVFMKVSHVLGWINTRIILGIFFYLLITPTGLIFKILRKDLLDRRLVSKKKSYWSRRADGVLDKNRYEKQY